MIVCPRLLLGIALVCLTSTSVFAQVTSVPPKKTTLLEILLTVDPSLPATTPVMVRMTGVVNVIAVHQESSRPGHVAAAVEVIRQLRAQYGDSLPGDVESAPRLMSAPDMPPDSKGYMVQELKAVKSVGLSRAGGRAPAKNVKLWLRPEPSTKKWPDSLHKTVKR